MHKCMHIYQVIYLNYFVCIVYMRKIENKHLKKLADYIHKPTYGHNL